jgi:prepilin-type N-terminal cleavage/methylation domain-containing protein
VKPPPANRRGFTLVELLVVIGIITVLIGILLPVLGKARASANTVKCLANLRSIGQAMLIYTSENDGWIPGSGATSARGIWYTNGHTYTINSGYTLANAPIVNEAMDWCAPIAHCMGLPEYNQDPIDYNGVQRFVQYCNTPVFQCPSNLGVTWTVSTTAGSTNAGTQQSFSYCTAMAFLMLANQDGQAQIGVDPSKNGYAGNVYILNPEYGMTLPTGYGPRIGKVGVGAQKVFMADGARCSYTSNMKYGPQYQTYTLRTDCWTSASCQNQTIYSDWGPCFGNTRSYDRSAVPGVNTPPDRDVRPMAFRHGATTPHQPEGAYRFNAVFYDGHAETMDDVTGANPALWMPSGSTINPVAALDSTDSNGNATCLFSDIISKYNLGACNASNLYTAP